MLKSLWRSAQPQVTQSVAVKKDSPVVMAAVPSVLRSAAQVRNLQRNVSKTNNKHTTLTHTLLDLQFTVSAKSNEWLSAQVLADRVHMEPSMTKVTRCVNPGVPSEIYPASSSICHCSHVLLLLLYWLTDLKNHGHSCFIFLIGVPIQIKRWWPWEMHLLTLSVLMFQFTQWSIQRNLVGRNSIPLLYFAF